MPQQRLPFKPLDPDHAVRRRSSSGDRAATGAPRPSSHLNKEARARLGRHMIRTVIPTLLQSNPRAAQGVQGSRLLRGERDLPRLERPPDPQSTSRAAPTPDPLSSYEEDVTADQSSSAHLEANRYQLRVSIVALDSFAAAHIYRQKDPEVRIAVLNMASTYQPGGGVLRGALAQEEALCLRSTLYPSLKPSWYRLPEDAVAWTEDVLVFAESDPQKGIKMLHRSQSWYVDVVSCAAIKNPATQGLKSQDYADPRDEEFMVLKIKYIMRACAQMGCKVVILGALGCGAYGNPIERVAGMMKRVLLGRQANGQPDENWFAAGIEDVAIAIMDHAPGRKVWKGFTRVFAEDERVKIEDSNALSNDT